MNPFACLFCRSRHSQLKLIMSKLNTLEEQIAEIRANQAEANTEIRAKLESLNTRILELETALGDVEIPVAAQTALDAAKTESRALADIIPGTPEPPAPPANG